jgi:hypothetical protein
MKALAMMTSVDTDVPELGADLLRFASSVNELATPDQVLDGLHQAIRAANHLSVLGALLFPIRWGDTSAIVLGKTLFLHKSAPKGWWEESVELARSSPNANVGLAQLALGTLHRIGGHADARTHGR